MVFHCHRATTVAFYLYIIICLHFTNAKSVVSSTSPSLQGVMAHKSNQELTLRRKRAATADDRKLWPDGIIPYKFDKKLQERFREMLINAIDHWENHTCIDFVEKTRNDEDFVVFTTESCGCCSSVGKIGGKQTVSLRDECATQAVAIHELGHVIGFWHEHTRPDRDKYIKVHWDNIIKEKQVNFDKRNTIEIDSRGRPYDLNSIMHYGPRTFAVGNGDTMTAIDGSRMVSPEAQLSREDILQTRLMYNCPEPECKHLIKGTAGGYIYTPYYPNRYLKDTTCTWVFEVEENHHIHLVFEKFELQDGYRCSSDYLEIRIGDESGDLIGYFCGSGLPPPITSTRQLYLKFFSDWIVEMSGFRARYQIESMRHSEQMNLMLNGFGHAESDVVDTDNTECVSIATSKSGSYTTLDLPNGSLEDSIECSFIIQADQQKLDAFRSIVIKMQSVKHRAYGPNCMGDVYTYTKSSNQYIHQFESSGDEDTLNSSEWTINNYYCSGPNKILEFNLLAAAVFINWRSSEHKTLQLDYWTDYDECLAGEDNCEQVCENTVEGYICSCYSGFTAYNDTHCEVKNLKLEDQCQQEIAEDAGIVRSSTEPYPHCSYNIILPDKKIIINFIRIHLPVSGDCRQNYVEVRSGKRLLANICDSIEGLELDAGESMTIIRYANLSSVHRLPYFKAEYYSFSKLQDRCVFDVYGSGVLQSPGYPLGYEPSSRCIWKLLADGDHVVEINFADVDLEDTDGCQFDKLNVYDGRKRIPSSLITTACGRRSNLIIRSTGRHMVLEFITDGDGDGRGFLGNFTSAVPHS